ncbi:hypothetical protein [Petrachloros mirabilis]
MSKKRISFDVMDDGKLVPKFYQRDLKRMKEVAELLDALPSEGMGQAKIAAQALRNVVDGVYEVEEE